MMIASSYRLHRRAGRRWLCGLMVLAAGLGLVGCSGNGESSGEGSGAAGASPAARHIANALDGFVTNGQTSGYAFLMVGRDSDGNFSVLDQRADGSYLDDGEPMTLDTPVLLASASKGPAAAAILTLVDQGKLNLDTPVSTYLASMGVSWPLGKAAITLRMLLDHTSGLPGIFSPKQPACIDVLDKGGATSESMQQCVQDIANSTLQAIPGNRFIYGGADYQVAGYIAYRTAGAASWPAFFKSALAGPLGAATLTYSASQINPRVAGGAVASAADYVKFLEMLLADGQYNGRSILNASSVTALRTSQIGTLTATPPTGATASDFSGYSFGFFQDAPATYAPSPGPEFSDQGIFGETPWIDYGLNYAAVLLIGQIPSGGSALAIGTDMWQAIHGYAVTLAQQQP